VITREGNVSALAPVASRTSAIAAIHLFIVCLVVMVAKAQRARAAPRFRNTLTDRVTSTIHFARRKIEIVESNLPIRNVAKFGTMLNRKSAIDIWQAVGKSAPAQAGCRQG
jgi:hypothetical protein